MSDYDPTLAARTLPAGAEGYRVPLYFAVHGGLHYIRGNHAPYFNLTYWQHRRGHPGQCEAGGAGHDTIARYFGDRFADLAALHLADIDGVPSSAEANGWYWLAGALGGAGERFHGSNSTSPRTPAECLDILADHLRISRAEAGRLADEALEERTHNPDGWAAARAAFGLRLDDMRPRWKAEADAAIARHHLRVYGDPWPEPPRMMPGHEPYTAAELVTLHQLVGDAAAGDPGEAGEAIR